jgi:AAA15 family ATPase/GTPase
MKESISIKNFGPIKEVEIDDIRPFTVFIGESGSGKSTIMKVLVLFRWIYKMQNISSYLYYSKIIKSLVEFDIDEYLENGGLTEYLQADTEIIYQKGNTKIHYKSLSPHTHMPIISQEELSWEKMCWIADKRNLIPDILSARRISSKMPFEKTINIDDIINFYLRETYNDFVIASDKQYVPEVNLDYLGVKYFSKNINLRTEYFIEGVSGDKTHKPIKLEAASSGMQTVAPLSIIIEYFSKHYDFSKRFNNKVITFLSNIDSLKDFRPDLNIGDIKNRTIHIHIEEPELSLYPESQRSLINFIVNRCFIQKHNGYDMTVMMATHSPYIINHLNLLIKAYDTGKMVEVENAGLNYDDIAVYQVDEGKIYDLKMKNERLINTNPLSNTIDDIYNEYNEL